MNSHDGCLAEEKHGITTLPTSSSPNRFPRIGGNNCNAVFFGTFVPLVFGVLAKLLIFLRWKGNLFSQRSLINEPPSAPLLPSGPSTVPVVFLRDVNSGKKPVEEILRSVIQTYEKEISQALLGLSTMLDAASEAEALARSRKQWNSIKCHGKLFSSKIEQRIQRTASCLEHDEHILKKLLGNVSYISALPDGEVYGDESDENDTEPIEEKPSLRTGNGTNYRIPLRNKKVIDESETHSYDSATQIWAHLVRDWTSEGRAIRRVIYDWCCQQMEIHCQNSSATVLVPGSGMGRLAYDLYRRGFIVEANELSPSMAVAASSILRNQVSGFFHPYVLDGMANEVDSKRRFDSISFPDVPIQTIVSTGGNSGMPNDCEGCGSLSYTVGDFVGNDDFYYRRQRVAQFDAVVTCFFIDTATNIYEYLETIRKLLRPRTGVWINVGPVQWHHNAVLRPSVDELKDLIEAFGWIIRVWSVDKTPISYRDEHDPNAQPRMTSYDGYRPLRFVAIPS